VQRPAGLLQGPAQESPRQPALAHLARLDETQFRASAGRAPWPCAAATPAKVHHRHNVAARVVVAVDAVPSHQRLGVLDAVIGEAGELRGHVLAEQQVGGRQVLADGRREVACVASARAVAAEIALQDDGLDARFMQRERRREPGVATADDRDVGAQVASRAGCRAGAGSTYGLISRKRVPRSSIAMGRFLAGAVVRLRRSPRPARVH